MYSFEELQQYAKLLNGFALEAKSDFTLSIDLANVFHTVSMGYSANSNTWEFFDVNNPDLPAFIRR